MVIQTMAVDRKSSAASTSEARTEREDVRAMTTLLPIRRMRLATRLR